MNKAIALGIDVDPAVEGTYALPLNPEYALDQLHSSWSVLKGFPKTRSIPSDAVIANSVAVRCRHDSLYRPSNLKFVNEALSASYTLDPVVSEPEAAEQAERAMPATGR